VPAFSETSSPELNDVLASMREKHFIPAYLNKQERRLIFGTKHKQNLEDNPHIITLGDEEIELKWIDRRKEIPGRAKLFHQAVDLMAETTDGQAWANLPRLLTGLQRTTARMSGSTMARIVRVAARKGRLGVIIQCLMQAEGTGMTLKDQEVLDHLLWCLRDFAQKSRWERGAVQRALKDARQVAVLLETEEHGGGWALKEDDARRRPEVIGVFLELAAVSAYKSQDGQDTDGAVRKYTERLLAVIGDAANVSDSRERSDAHSFCLPD
jgi:hypothetical protein